MIDVKKTIFQSLKHWLNLIFKLANNNPVALKKVLYLIILDDLLDWAEYLEEPLSILKKLKDLRFTFIDLNKEIKPMFGLMCACTEYTNVNVPQTNSTWLRLCDASYTEISSDIVKQCFVEDSTYQKEVVSLPFYKNGVKVIYIENNLIISINDLLTIHDKMNYYVDELDRIWYMDPHDCTWKLKNTNVDTLGIIDEVLAAIPQNVKITYKDGGDNAAVYTLSKDSDNNEIDIMDLSELDNII